jgi:hypothetical protein
LGGMPGGDIVSRDYAGVRGVRACTEAGPRVNWTCEDAGRVDGGRVAVVVDGDTAS